MSLPGFGFSLKVAGLEPAVLIGTFRMSSLVGKVGSSTLCQLFHKVEPIVGSVTQGD